MSIDDTRKRAATISLARLEEKADGIDATQYFSDDEIRELFAHVDDGEWAKVDRILESVEGRIAWPNDDDPQFAETKAQGGWDKNRGNAETLRHYWVRGPGAAKIAWGTKGDWYRCVAELSKYMGTRAKGYCTLRHKDALGVWPGHPV